MQQFYLEKDSLLWLHRDIEKKQVKQNVRTKKRDKEKGVEMTVRTKENEEEGKDEEGVEITVRVDKEGVEITVRVKETEEDGKVEMREWLCIPKTMQRQILHDVHNISVGGQNGAE